MPIWLGVLLAVLGLGIGFGVTLLIFISGSKKSKNTAAKVLENAYAEAKTAKKEAILEAKEEIQTLKEKFDEEVSEKRGELMRNENKLLQKEETLKLKETEYDSKLQHVEETTKKLNTKEQQLEQIKKEAEEATSKVDEQLQKVAGMTKDQAKKTLIEKYTDEAKKEAATIVRNIEQTAKDEASKKAKEIVSLAIQKCATDHTSEITVTVVPLPNDEMKGRIIGREGRNIRAIENATGIDLIIDDTPEAVVLSGFDPIRREIARMSLEKLIMDGRIHPARIEEIVEKAQKDVENSIKEAGDNAVYESGLLGVHPEIARVLGKLKYRTSYCQNCLVHSLEVCHLAGLLAAEVGADIQIAKRGGLLHDLGKALDFEMEGTHVQLGVDIAKKYKESPAVIHCIEAHHGDVEFKTIEAILVQVADAISSSRPGARRESLDTYIKRLEKLEGIANSFKGVEKSFAIQAGREIRIMVKPEEIDDAGAVFLAKDIAKKIEEEMEYPGQIRVNVIRETRSIETAK
ncbi:MAG: ribonuclease Y [Christensenellaceae bacterium]|jgi:ribonuclease Y|nr:ribonuclease Y [Christensenellaceae bacterium]